MASTTPPFALTDAARTVGSLTGDAAAAALASAQEGLVTTAQLRFVGLSRDAIAHRVRAGRLFPVHRGVYLVGHTVRTELTPIAAALLALGPLSFASHLTAAWLWGMVESLAAPIDLSVRAGGPRNRPGIRVHRMAGVSPRDIRWRGPIPLTSPSATVLDLADLGDVGLVGEAINRGRQRRLITEGELRAQIDRSPGRRGLGILMQLLRSEANEDFDRSEAERILRRLIRAASLPAPRSNRKVHGIELDFFWPEIRLNVEIDGYEWHSTRDRLNSDRERDALLTSRGIQVLRFTWDQLRRPAEVVAQLAAAIAIARTRVSQQTLQEARPPVAVDGP